MTTSTTHVHHHRPKPTASQSLRNLFRHPETPDKPSAGVWDSMRNLHSNTSRVFNPLHKKVEKLTNSVGNRLGRPGIGKLLFLLYKIAPLTIFLLCAPTWVVATAYVGIFLTVKVSKILHPNSFEKYSKQYAKTAAVACKYLAIYTAIKAVVFTIAIAIVKTDPHLNFIYSFIFAMATVDLTKFYKELHDKINTQTAPSISATHHVHAVVHGHAQSGQANAAPTTTVSTITTTQAVGSHPPATLPAVATAHAVIQVAAATPSPLKDLHASTKESPVQPPPEPSARKQLFTSQSPRNRVTLQAVDEGGDSSEEDSPKKAKRKNATQDTKRKGSTDETPVKGKSAEKPNGLEDLEDEGDEEDDVNATSAPSTPRTPDSESDEEDDKPAVKPAVAPKASDSNVTVRRSSKIVVH